MSDIMVDVDPKVRGRGKRRNLSSSNQEWSWCNSDSDKLLQYKTMQNVIQWFVFRNMKLRFENDIKVLPKDLGKRVMAKVLYALVSTEDFSNIISCNNQLHSTNIFQFLYDTLSAQWMITCYVLFPKLLDPTSEKNDNIFQACLTESLQQLRELLSTELFGSPTAATFPPSNFVHTYATLQTAFETLFKQHQLADTSSLQPTSDTVLDKARSICLLAVANPTKKVLCLRAVVDLLNAPTDVAAPSLKYSVGIMVSPEARLFQTHEPSDQEKYHIELYNRFPLATQENEEEQTSSAKRAKLSTEATSADPIDVDGQATPGDGFMPMIEE